ncbi:MAG: UPF0175 family protein [Bacteroidia bacterium]
MTIEIPDHLLEGRTESDIKLQIAIALFQAEIFTLAQASRFAGKTRWDFQQVLGRLKIPMHYGIQEVEQDLKTIEKLFGDSSK